MAASDHYFLKPAVEQALGVSHDAQGNPVLGPDTAKMLDYLNQFRMELDAARATTLDLAARLLTQQQVSAGLAQLVHTIVGGETVAASIQALYTLLQQDIASDATTAADLLARIQSVSTVASGAATNVQLARTVADQALATTQTQATTLTDLGQKLTEKLPLAGGTLTGPLNVMAPASASNPLQLSSMPLSMTVQQPLPLIALGGAYSFPVPAATARVGQVAVLNVQAPLLASLSRYDAVVTAANTVTVTLKAGLQIAASMQTFYLAVLR